MRNKKVLAGLKKGSINQRVGFRLGSGWIHHSGHLEVEIWTLGIGGPIHESKDVVWVCRNDGQSRSMLCALY